mgnify:CR=1 FL=1
MKKILTLISTLALILGLSSCGKSIDYKDNLDDYIYAMEFHENFNILQLADIHWNYNTSTSESKDYLINLLEIVDSHIKEEQGANAKIDLIELDISSIKSIHNFVNYIKTNSIDIFKNFCSIR